jgi:hypothetical protein
MPDADVTKLTNLLKNNNTFTKLLKAAALEVPPPTE